jgi:hypothetical protein
MLAKKAAVRRTLARPPRRGDPPKKNNRKKVPTKCISVEAVIAKLPLRIQSTKPENQKELVKG